MSRKLLIMGAAGRDFHVFNCCFRDNPEFRVVAFTATQIPHIEDRLYPPDLAGSLYPEGIPIHPESDLDTLLQAGNVDEVVFAYSDVSLAYVDARRVLDVRRRCDDVALIETRNCRDRCQDGLWQKPDLTANHGHTQGTRQEDGRRPPSDALR